MLRNSDRVTLSAQALIGGPSRRAGRNSQHAGKECARAPLDPAAGIAAFMRRQLLRQRVGHHERTWCGQRGQAMRRRDLPLPGPWLC